MNLLKLFQMQKELDDYIVKTKGLEGADLLPQKILALQVELGECANEWRGFKFWSKNQTPKNKESKQCSGCRGFGLKTKYIDDNGIATMKCEKCKGEGEIPHNPLLEEYVDCLHFILSIGLELNADEWDLEAGGFEPFVPYDDPTEHFVDVLNYVGGLRNIKGNEHEYEIYKATLEIFLGLGEALGFTWEQIEQAYTDKWNINKQRQENGY